MTWTAEQGWSFYRSFQRFFWLGVRFFLEGRTAVFFGVLTRLWSDLAFPTLFLPDLGGVLRRRPDPLVPSPMNTSSSRGALLDQATIGFAKKTSRRWLFAFLGSK